MTDPRSSPYQDFLSCSPEYLTADPVELFTICNGCGSAQAKFDFVPDSVYGLSIKPACFIHDWDYHHGKTASDKRRADIRLLDNTLMIIDMGSANGFMKWIRRRRAYKYYDAVASFGGKAFWSGKLTV